MIVPPIAQPRGLLALQLYKVPRAKVDKVTACTLPLFNAQQRRQVGCDRRKVPRCTGKAGWWS